ncbi:MAG: hypothetical protein Q8P82_00705 [bacterium]|nr:hypothetical protein [bacterium]
MFHETSEKNAENKIKSDGLFEGASARLGLLFGIVAGVAVTMSAAVLILFALAF